MGKLQEADTKNLQHMLGADSRYTKKQWGFRNHFSAGGDDVLSMKRLEKEGFVREIKSSLCDDLYVATEAGCKHIGFSKKQIANAMEPY